MGVRSTGSKRGRAQPRSAAVFNGHVMIKKDSLWAPNMVYEFVRFPNPSLAHDDQVDAVSGAYNTLAGNYGSSYAGLGLEEDMMTNDIPSLGFDGNDIPEDDAKASELVGGHEIVAGNRYPVGESEIREAIATGLFTSRGPSRMGWAHYTYGEFLAAHYLAHSDMSFEQLLSLIVHQGGDLVRHADAAPTPQALAVAVH